MDLLFLGYFPITKVNSLMMQNRGTSRSQLRLLDHVHSLDNSAGWPASGSKNLVTIRMTAWLADELMHKDRIVLYERLCSALAA